MSNPIYQDIRKTNNSNIIRSHKQGSWILLQKKPKPNNELRVIISKRVKSDISSCIESGWITVVAMYIKNDQSIPKIVSTLEGKSDHKVRGLISKTTFCEYKARELGCDLFVRFNYIFKWPNSERYLIRLRK